MSTTRIKCIITDDEPFARKGLQGYIGQIDFLDLRGICENAIELNSLLKREPVDLLFLDIEMPYLTGIDFLKQLATPPRVIFTTAYEKYAVQGFELEVLDYLLKPISFDRFLKAANKAFDYFLQQQTPAATEDYIFVKADSRLEKIAFADILFAEALENYVAIYTREKKVITHLTLKMLQEKLPPSAFVQPHKSYLVAIDKINSIEGNILHITQYQVPISKYQKEEIMEKIVNSKLLKR
ncbi:MAG TPA: LytTR family DNA-binding domain-containing protein [Puia sp.]|uniref:LytR/AlgR family response regulator transcription factor n=1 Tax=Puia sp. TaxID=2045100 RepID=UPI002CE45DEE|nr:LytTR family DNA-binding domain-containing protein [Puia sp.]HVU95576.1 LytTR family DNA-binding domain-containing protein [Puia sp.]